MEEKVCSKCKEVKSILDFYKDKKNKDGLYSQCKDCAKKYSQSSKGKARNRRNNMRQYHGPNAIELFNEFFAKQEGNCPGCGRHESELKRHLDLDHDHETGEYRGLLCSVCNKRAGSSKKDLQILKNLVEYLEDFYEVK